MHNKEQLTGKWLELATLGYLGIPCILFFLGWLQPILALALSAGTLAGIVLAWREYSSTSIASESASPSSTGPRPLGWKTVAFAACVALAWCHLSGAGGYGQQKTDWKKHNRVLKDLIDHSWPVEYSGQPITDTAAGPGYLSYAIGYYLPAALVGKAAGWAWANHALFAWTVLGATLCLLWFAHHTSMRIVAVLAFPLLSGLDCIGEGLVHGTWFAAGSEHKEWWALFAQYPSNMTCLFWVPQHGLAGWLLAGVLLHRSLSAPAAAVQVFALSLTALWSPFVFLGGVPLVVVGCLAARGRHLFKPVLLVSAALITAAVGLYSLGHHGIPHHLVWHEPPVMFKRAYLSTTTYSLPLLWSLFGLLEFGLLAVLMMCLLRSWRRRDAWLFWCTVLILLVLPCYRLGEFSDLTMRSCLPALFLLWVFVLRAIRAAAWDQLFARRRFGRSLRTALAVLVIVGAAWPALDLYHAWKRYEHDVPRNPGTLLDFPEKFRIQYIVHKQTPFDLIRKSPAAK